MKQASIVILLLAAACGRQPADRLVLRGTVPGAMDSTEVALVPNGRFSDALKTFVVDGKFVIEGKFDRPAYCELRMDNYEVCERRGIKDDGAETVRWLKKFYRLVAKKTKEKGMRVYGGTIMPFKNSFAYSETHEKARQEVNQWIRTAPDYDGVIDFDKATADPKDPEALMESLQSDWLHPNADGYKVMGECAAKAFK